MKDILMILFWPITLPMAFIVMLYHIIVAALQ